MSGRVVLQYASISLPTKQSQIERSDEKKAKIFHGLQNKRKELWGAWNQTRLENKHQQHNKRIDSGASYETTQAMSNDVEDTSQNQRVKQHWYDDNHPVSLTNMFTKCVAIFVGFWLYMDVNYQHEQHMFKYVCHPPCKRSKSKVYKIQIKPPSTSALIGVWACPYSLHQLPFLFPLPLPWLWLS